MDDAPLSTLTGRAPPNGAEFSARVGNKITVDARISPIGLISVGLLVSGILLSSAVIVAAARRNELLPLLSRVPKNNDS